MSKLFTVIPNILANDGITTFLFLGSANCGAAFLVPK